MCLLPRSDCGTPDRLSWHPDRRTFGSLQTALTLATFIPVLSSQTYRLFHRDAQARRTTHPTLHLRPRSTDQMECYAETLRRQKSAPRTPCLTASHYTKSWTVIEVLNKSNWKFNDWERSKLPSAPDIAKRRCILHKIDIHRARLYPPHFRLGNEIPPAMTTSRTHRSLLSTRQPSESPFRLYLKLV